jgi:hypothetical protein
MGLRGKSKNTPADCSVKRKTFGDDLERVMPPRRLPPYRS